MSERERNWASEDRLAKYKAGIKSATATPTRASSDANGASATPAATAAEEKAARRIIHERYFERYSPALGDWEPIEDPVPAVPLSSITSIKCISYNVWFVDRFFDERREALCNILKHERPDVICLQEITERFLQYIISLDWVQSEYWISDTRGTTVHPYGVLMLTKLPVKRLTFHPLQSRMGRKLLLLELSLSDTTMAIGTVHLESMDNTSKRCQQLLYILDVCLKDFEHAMVMGDFNFHEVSPENDECIATHPEYVDLWPFLHDGEDGHTVTETRTRFSGFRIDRMLLRSDHFFANSIDRIGREPILTDTVVNSDGATELEPIFPSDHYGLCSVIAPLD